MKSNDSILIPLGIGLVLGGLNLAPRALERYFDARFESQSRSIEADSIYGNWRGQLILGEFYLDSLDQAANDAIAGRVSGPDTPLPEAVRKVVASGAIALGVPAEEQEEQLLELRESLRAKVTRSVGRPDFLEVMVQLREESPISPLQISAMGKEADSARAKANAAKSKLSTSLWLLIFNCFTVSCTTGAGIAMLWKTLISREGQSPQVENEPKDLEDHSGPVATPVAESGAESDLEMLSD